MLERQVRVVVVAALLVTDMACGGAQPTVASAGAAQQSGVVSLQTASGFVRLSVLTPGTVRVLISRSEATKPPASFAVEPAEQMASVPYTLENSGNALVLRTGQLALRVTKNPLQVALLDTQGHVVSQESAPISWLHSGLMERWLLAPNEQVFGLGDKSRGFDRRGQAFELWNSDAYGWAPNADPLYKSIPFFLFLNGGRAHGLFLDSPVRAQIDVGKAAGDTLSYTAEAGDALDFYLFAGPDPKEVVRSFTALTGRTPLPPRWALGYHQSRYSYLTEQETRDVAARLRADAIPTDAIWLDIDYQLGNAPFTVDAQAFPDFPGMISDLRHAGLRTVVITDPHPKSYQGTQLPSGYAPYDTGAAGDDFLHDPSGGFFVDKVWPGASVFPDFTLSRVRRWWGGLYQGFVNQGVAGFWNDMNEPATFGETKTLPVFVRHRLDDGSSLDHLTVHNAYGSLNARATYQGLLELRPNERPFVLTRAAYAGAQRFAATWTGDNSATREHLALSIGQLANLGISGYAFAGADVGGFVGCPDADLLAEWMELAALQPFFRNHSMKDSCRREPWVYGAATEARIRAAIERRYRLLPYLYTVFEEASRTGLPVLRPLWLEYPNDTVSAGNSAIFLLGRDLLVAPKLVPGRVGYDVSLPHADWYDTTTGALIAGGGHVQVSASDDSVRLFARAGAIIASQPVVQDSDEAPRGPLHLDVWPGAECDGALYLDDGHSFAFKSGASRRIKYACGADAKGIRVSSASSGPFPTWWSATTVVVHGVPHAPHAVLDAMGATLISEYDAEHHSVTVHLAGANADWSAQLSL
ncbi:MAG TPA: glycoside hydrolase family 31 protein [Polyangiaceae bacterium]